MPTWQAQLRKLVEIFEELPEPLTEAFLVEPPSGKAWRKGIPSCPALQEFYSLCDGGTFSYYTLSALGDLQKFDEEEVEGNRYLAIGDTQFGHTLVWDSREDRVGYYDFDGADGLVMSAETGAALMGLPMEGFLRGLFTPPTRPNKRDDVEKAWIQVLERLQQGD
jgi:hypothetical protein